MAFATQALPLNAGAQSPLQTQAAAAPAQNRPLNRFVEMPFDTSDATWATVWQVAAIASLVAYVVLAAIAILFTGMTDPFFLPVVTALAMRCIDYAWDVFCYCEEKSRSALDNSVLEVYGEELLKTIPETNNELIQWLLTNNHIFNLPQDCSAMQNPVELRLILARYMACLAKNAELSKEQQKMSRKVSCNSEELINDQLNVFHLKEKILEQKVIAAYLRVIILNRHVLTEMTEVLGFPLKMDSLRDRLMREAISARLSSRTEPEVFVRFFQVAGKLTTAQVDQMSIPELAVELARHFPEQVEVSIANQ